MPFFTVRSHELPRATGEPLGRRSATLAVSALVLVLASCASATPQTPDHAGAAPSTSQTTPTGDTAPGPATAETSAAQAHIVTIDVDGTVALTDLSSHDQSVLGVITRVASTAAESRSTDPSASTPLATDARYVFATSSEGVDIIDSGVWTWDHGDHSHYYHAAPSIIGSIQGDGPATIATGPLATAGSTGIFFSGSAEAVLLDNEALSQGTITERLRLSTTAHDGLIAPLGDGALLTDAAPDGTITSLRVINTEGQEQSSIACTNARGTITTRIGVVVGCEEGAVLATASGEQTSLDLIAYPIAATAPPATQFHARKHRPSVAGLGSDRHGFWILNTRDRAWAWHVSKDELVAVSAIDDADHRVVAVSADARVLIFNGATGDLTNQTDPLFVLSPDDPLAAPPITLSVDSSRAYINNPADGTIFEIDFQDPTLAVRTVRSDSPLYGFALTGQ